jgi:hypothetical protein
MTNLLQHGGDIFGTYVPRKGATVRAAKLSAAVGASAKYQRHVLQIAETPAGQRNIGAGGTTVNVALSHHV